MLVTKEQQESWVNAYIKERHTIDECRGFIDGIEKALNYEMCKLLFIKKKLINVSVLHANKK